MNIQSIINNLKTILNESANYLDKGKTVETRLQEYIDELGSQRRG